MSGLSVTAASHAHVPAGVTVNVDFGDSLETSNRALVSCAGYMD